MFPLYSLSQTHTKWTDNKKTSSLSLQNKVCTLFSLCFWDWLLCIYKIQAICTITLPRSLSLLTYSSYNTRANYLYFKAPRLQHSSWQFYLILILWLRDQNHVQVNPLHIKKQNKTKALCLTRRTLPWQRCLTQSETEVVLKNTYQQLLLLESHKPSFVPYCLKLQKATCRNSKCGPRQAVSVPSAFTLP